MYLEKKLCRTLFFPDHIPQRSEKNRILNGGKQENHIRHRFCGGGGGGSGGGGGGGARPCQASLENNYL